MGLLGCEASSAGLSIPRLVYLTLPNIGFWLLKTSSWAEMGVISPARSRCHSALQHPHLVVHAGASARAAGTRCELPSCPAEHSLREYTSVCSASSSRQALKGMVKVLER